MQVRHAVGSAVVDACVGASDGWLRLRAVCTRLRVRSAAIALGLIVLAVPAVAEPSRVSPSVLPEALRQKWNDLRPSFNENSRCAAVWDGGGDADKQALKCSIYMRMGSEAERRAMQACEEFRAEHKIRSTCRLVTP